jgi:Zn finger protein HypA/HybF involved in hydrogenase expression
MNVQCIETGKIYFTQTDASTELNASASSISLVCNGKRTTAGGYHFRYTNEPAEFVQRECRCGNTFMPTSKFQWYCCDRCKKPSPPKKTWKVKLGDSIPCKRPYTFETNMMIVRDDMRGKIKRSAEATGRSIESIKAQIKALKKSGAYDNLKKLININTELPRKEVGRVIA